MTEIIFVRESTYDLLASIRGQDESWDEFLLRLVRRERELAKIEQISLEEICGK